MVIGHEITHGFDDNGEEMTEKMLLFQLKLMARQELKCMGTGDPCTVTSSSAAIGAHWEHSVEGFVGNVSCKC